VNNEKATWDGNNLLLRIHLQPRASPNVIGALRDGLIRVRISAAPVDGKPALIAKRPGIPKSRRRIETGAKNRTKLLRFSGVKTKLNASSIREFLEQNK